MFSRQRGMSVKTDRNKQGWQKSDFPVACEKCFGENPYLRILKQNYGQQCRLCFRPFTVFKWKGDRGIYKRTCLCNSCSKDKNLCQVCTLDLEFGLPMEIRDKRCGENGKYLLNENFVNENSQKIKPPPPNYPAPIPRNIYQEKQAVYIPEEDQSDQENNNKEKVELKNHEQDHARQNQQKQGQKLQQNLQNSQKVEKKSQQNQQTEEKVNKLIEQQ